MKILQLCNKPPYPAKDGGALAMLNVTKALANQGHQVHVLAISTKKHNTNINNIPKGLKKNITFEFCEINTDISVIKALTNLFFSTLPYNAQRFVNKKFTHKIISTLQYNSFDIIQLEGLYLCPYIAVIRKYSNARIVYRAHNVEHEIWLRAMLKQPLGFKKLYLKSLVSRLKKFEVLQLNQYDLLVPISERDLLKLNKMGNTRPAFVMPFGIDGLPEQPNIHSEVKSLFFIGSLDWLPNQEGLIWFLEDVWSQVFLEFPHLGFNIAGRNAPKWLIEKFEKFENAHYYGEIGNAYAFMSENSVMVVPLFSGSGMRVKIIEGMAMGKVILSTTIGAEGIHYTNAENILIADTIQDFKTNIHEIMDNKTIFAKIGKNALNLVKEKYNNAKLTQELVSFFNKYPVWP